MVRDVLGNEFKGLAYVAWKVASFEREHVFVDEQHVQHTQIKYQMICGKTMAYVYVEGVVDEGKSMFRELKIVNLIVDIPDQDKTLFLIRNGVSIPKDQ
jgi:hypothetical protein